MRRNRLICLCTCTVALLFIAGSGLWAQDRLPSRPAKDKTAHIVKPAKVLKFVSDTIPVKVSFPKGFIGTAKDEITDSLGVLLPVLERLRSVKEGFSKDTVRIVHIGDSHVRGHIFPQTTGMELVKSFGAVSYTDMGVNGATCLTFTHPVRIADIAALKPELLILSFGTNESYGRGYNANVHYHQMDELIKLLRNSLPDVPMLMTTPPGSYASYRRKRRRRTYAANPRTLVAAETICKYGRENDLAVWDMYRTLGGDARACKNWAAARLMRPDHVHYFADGYVLQGELLYEAIIKAYNHYVFR
ncbi:SGNH/GDSL hydrolase family protein [uncultured Bacteroides sp.]|uniref:SGNH/GDSL hydrolase family protein n=1 Tax=uncultured Bacteroides sp. TaxID=162156 RepID=UPI002AA83888|nr:SGNH/GDSL hydrolase family protein [uncultured Bacteroides sp.]